MRFQKQKTILLATILSAALLSWAVPFAVRASGLVPCGGSTANSTDTGKPCTVEDIFTMLARVTDWLFWAAGILAVFYIVQAGFNLVISMGNEESITKNKNAITEAVVGFVFIMISYIIINTVVNGILLDGTGTSIDLKCPLTYLSVGYTCSNSSTK